MPAYVIFDVHVNDPAVYDEYQASARRPSVNSAEFARALVRGGKVETLEGGWDAGRLIILEFPDAEAARAWYNSAGYQEAKAIRERAASTRAVLVEGISG